MRLCAVGSILKTRTWLATCALNMAKSIRIMPITNDAKLPLNKPVIAKPIAASVSAIIIRALDPSLLTHLPDDLAPITPANAITPNKPAC